MREAPASTAGWWSALTSTRWLGIPAHLLRGLIWLYQKTVSPALVVIAPTCGCRFAPTCSHYASEALRTHGFFAGVGLAFLRLAKCGPWHPGGLDPVPPRARPACAAVTKSV